jgi:2-polyprenyl-3-methyl-5-hydroxy-6-metoxy-1,4-benzoquinol methylase
MQDRIIYPVCPLCDSKEIGLYKIADCSGHFLYDIRLSKKILWQQCNQCRHIFTEGYYTEEASNIIFSQVNIAQETGAYAEQQRLISSRMVEKALPYQSSGIWLDIGFGNGSLLFTAREYGFVPIGTDLRVDNVNKMNAMGIEAYCRNIEDLHLLEQCAVISMADVLEHVPYPKAMLKTAQELLKPGGVLLLSMPNSENVVWQLLDEANENPYWKEMEHYHNFSRTRLYALLAEFGFTSKCYGISERYRLCMEVIAQKD